MNRFPRGWLLHVLILSVTGCEYLVGISDTEARQPDEASNTAGGPASNLAGPNTAISVDARLPGTLLGDSLSDWPDVAPSVSYPDAVSGEPVDSVLDGEITGVDLDGGNTDVGLQIEARLDAGIDAADHSVGEELSRPLASDAAAEPGGETQSDSSSNDAQGGARVQCFYHDVGAASVLTGDTTGERENFAENPGHPLPGPSTALVWTAAVSGQYTFDTSSSPIDASLLISRTIDCHAAPAFWTDAGPRDTASPLGPLHLYAGERLLLGIGNSQGQAGGWRLNIRGPSSPVSLVNRIGDCLGLQEWDTVGLGALAEVYYCTESPRGDQQWILAPKVDGSVQLMNSLPQGGNMGKGAVCLKAIQREPSQGSNLEAGRCDADDLTQRWMLEPTPAGFFRLRSVARSDLFLGVDGIDGHQPGDLVEFHPMMADGWDWNLDSEWLLAKAPDEDRFKLASVMSGLCMTALAAEPGQRIDMEPCDEDATFQEWRKVPFEGAGAQMQLAWAPNLCLAADSPSAPLQLVWCNKRDEGSFWAIRESFNSLVVMEGAIENVSYHVDVDGIGTARQGSLVQSNDELLANTTSLSDSLWILF